MVNKQGQTRLAQYYEVRLMRRTAQDGGLLVSWRALHSSAVSRCGRRSTSPWLSVACWRARLCASAWRAVSGSARSWSTATTRHVRSHSYGACTVSRHPLQVVYRRYASLYVLAGVDGDENALAALEVVHAYVEALDRYFGAVCELDIMFHLEKAHYILDEMIMNGFVVETNRLKVLQPVQLLDAQTK